VSYSEGRRLERRPEHSFQGGNVIFIKTCAGRCGLRKPVSEFYKCKSGNGGLDSRCKECAKAWQKEVRQRGIQNGKDYTSPARRCLLRRNYKMSLEEYIQRDEKQKHLCEICKLPETVKQKSGRVSNLCVDHSHVTGQNRDLLCRRCNSVIGQADDSIELLEAMIQYLRRHSGNNPDAGNGIGTDLH